MPLAQLPLHVTLEGYGSEGPWLTIGGRSLEDILDTHGTTPLYVYHAGLIRNRVSQLRSAIPAAVDIHYAIKANPMPQVVGLLASLVDGLDVASAGELEVALSSDTDVADISFAGPGKKDEELRRAIESGVVINVESVGELQRIDRIAGEQGSRALVAIRVNPDFELKTSGMKMSGGPKAFGIDAESVPEVLARLPDTVNFQGLHIFCGSQNLNESSIVEAQTKSLELGLALCQDSGLSPRFMNIGGGFGIPYFPGDEPITLLSIGENLTRLTQRLERAYPASKLVIELGRYLVGEAGIYVCRIIDRKVSRGAVFLVTDGGLHHHLAASGNFGQVIRKNYPVLIANRLDAAETERASVVGPLCTPLDVLGDKMELARAEPGDVVVVFQSGAYGFSASPHRFLSHPAPAEILID